MSDHTPVLLKEVITLLDPKPGDVLLDATLGHGGHSKAFLDAAGDGAKVVGVDADENALVIARQVLSTYSDAVTYQRGNFFSLPEGEFNSILFDLGIGSHQIADETRGFSFSSHGPVKMQYGDATVLPDSHIEEINVLTRRLGHYPDAHELLDMLSPIALSETIRFYGEEKYAGVIANAIVEGRPFVSASKLAHTIEEVLPKFYEKGRIHKATRTFQALRLAVNRELEVLTGVLPQAVDRLVSGGVIAVISFHSLEDRIVKQYFRKEAATCICPPEQVVCICEHAPTLEILTKHPVVASEEELKENPRSRSAKLRAAKKK